MTFDSYYWFSEPSSFLSSFDKSLGLSFAVVAALGLALLVFKYFAKNKINRKLLNRFSQLFFWTGLAGVIWFGFRYEATPFFARRFLAALVVVVGLVWLGWIMFYLLFKFHTERKSFFEEEIRQRYIPKSKSR